jgi:hypothetical protein
MTNSRLCERLCLDEVASFWREMPALLIGSIRQSVVSTPAVWELELTARDERQSAELLGQGKNGKQTRCSQRVRDVVIRVCHLRRADD